MKVALLGDGAVGKTALRERYLGKEFTSSYLMTIGADFAVQKTEVAGKDVKFQIWDLAGQERFNSVRSLYYQGSHGAIFVFDVTRPESYQNLIDGWLQELMKHIRGGPIPAVVLGNKIDLRNPNDPSHLKPEQGKELAVRMADTFSKGVMEMPYLETSAKTGENVQTAFKLLAEMIISGK
ncbi:MAG: Rab family GTPase [Candidatus Thorarchaeota archaeon]